MPQQFPFDQIDDLYRHVILDHHRNPRNTVKLNAPEVEYEEYNPICGDGVVLQLKLDSGRIHKAAFQGQGCSISQASASILTESVLGKSLDEAEVLSRAFRQMMQGNAPSNEEPDGLGDLEALQGVRKFPVRIKCALLAWAALEEGIRDYRAANS